MTTPDPRPVSPPSELTAEPLEERRVLREGIDRAVAILEHTSDHHATDARLTLLALSGRDGMRREFPWAFTLVSCTVMVAIAVIAWAVR